MQLCSGDKEAEVEVDSVEEAAAAAATRPSALRTVNSFIL
jgi:hypothetical protein